MTIKELRAAAGMTQQEFSNYFGFSKRAVESWEGEKRSCPQYLIDLIRYKLLHEGLIGRFNPDLFPEESHNLSVSMSEWKSWANARKEQIPQERSQALKEQD